MVCRPENWDGVLSLHRHNCSAKPEQVYSKRRLRLTALTVTPSSITIWCYISVMYLHGVDGNSQSRVIPIHFIFFASFIVCRAVLMSCPNSINPQGDDENQYAHTDYDNNSSHTWNSWNKEMKRERAYVCGWNSLQNTKYVDYFSPQHLFL